MTKTKTKAPKGTGDCYEAALHFVIALPDADRDAYRVVHGFPTGQGAIAGVVHGHAWVERQDPPPVIPANTPPEHAAMFAQALAATPPESWITVIDKSNGKDIEMPRSFYYGIGRIDPAECRYYEVAEACRLAVVHGHYGAWPDS